MPMSKREGDWIAECQGTVHIVVKVPGCET